MSESPRRTNSGPGRALVAVYGIFALAATSRAAVQLATRYDEAPLAYLLSAFAAVVYIVATVTLGRRQPASRRVAIVAVTTELIGVLAVGTASVLYPAAFPRATVWSIYGIGYGFVPLAAADPRPDLAAADQAPEGDLTLAQHAEPGERFDQFALLVRQMREQGVGQFVGGAAVAGRRTRIGDEGDQGPVQRVEHLVDDDMFRGEPIDDRSKPRIRAAQPRKQRLVLDRVMGGDDAADRPRSRLRRSSCSAAWSSR